MCGVQVDFQELRLGLKRLETDPPIELTYEDFEKNVLRRGFAQLVRSVRLYLRIDKFTAWSHCSCTSMLAHAHKCWYAHKFMHAPGQRDGPELFQNFHRRTAQRVRAETNGKSCRCERVKQCDQIYFRHAWIILTKLRRKLLWYWWNCFDCLQKYNFVCLCSDVHSCSHVPDEVKPDEKFTAILRSLQQIAFVTSTTQEGLQCVVKDVSQACTQSQNKPYYHNILYTALGMVFLIPLYEQNGPSCPSTYTCICVR